jgi:hypothetical protein
MSVCKEKIVRSSSFLFVPLRSSSFLFVPLRSQNNNERHWVYSAVDKRYNNDIFSSLRIISHCLPHTVDNVDDFSLTTYIYT